MKLLCAADLHMGRASSRLPADLPASLGSTSEAWHRLVEAAIRLGVDAVLLAGDVVDRKNRYFEATGPLETGVRALADAGIACVAVGGNHDFDVLPALARDLGGLGFHLLGTDGRWSRFTLERRGERVEIHGWSFRSDEHREDPLSGYDLDAPSDAPVIGLLHADLDVPESRYAPVRLAALRARPPHAWVLGHVHARAIAVGPGAPVLYPGSPQALDPGERGPHGALLLEIGPGRVVEHHWVPLSTVRYDELDVDVAGLTDELEVGSRVRAAARAALDESPGSGPLRLLSLRLTLRGRTTLHRRLASYLSSVREDLRLAEGQVEARVERVRVETSPAYDLDALAAGSDAPAVLASLVLALRTANLDDRQRQLLADASQIVQRAGAASHYLEFEESVPPAGSLLEERAMMLLDGLLAQREEAA